MLGESLDLTCLLLCLELSICLVLVELFPDLVDLLSLLLSCLGHELEVFLPLFECLLLTPQLGHLFFPESLNFIMVLLLHGVELTLLDLQLLVHVLIVGLLLIKFLHFIVVLFDGLVQLGLLLLHEVFELWVHHEVAIHLVWLIVDAIVSRVKGFGLGSVFVLVFVEHLVDEVGPVVLDGFVFSGHFILKVHLVLLLVDHHLGLLLGL